MNIKRFIISFFVTFVGCIPVIVNKDIQTATESSSDSTIVAPETSYIFQKTYLDSLNRNKEIGLSEGDFGKPIQPTVIQTVEESGSGYEIHYRIQVFASSTVESLREQKNNLEKKIDLPFYLTFEPPFYKLFVGDFRLRPEAEAMLPKVKKYGYTDAWIVTARSLD